MRVSERCIQTIFAIAEANALASPSDLAFDLIHGISLLPAEWHHNTNIAGIATVLSIVGGFAIAACKSNKICQLFVLYEY